MERHNFREEQKSGAKSATVSASKGSLFAKQQQQMQEEEAKTATQEMMDAEEKVLYNHLECVKQEAQLITVEGEIITRLEHAMSEGESYDMKEYLNTAEEIAEQKLKMYTALLEDVKRFKTKYASKL